MLLILITMERPVISLDKIRGMLIGGAIGDAIGAPHEHGTLPYTGILTDKVTYHSRFHGWRTYALGQLTDDTEMTLTVARCLVSQGGFNRDAMVMAYLKWVDSGVTTIGKNTRDLFKGVTTLRGYENRYADILKAPLDQWSQSNGSLMRSSPFALIWDNDVTLTDCKITNPHPVNQDTNLVYITALRLALLGYPQEKIFTTLQAMPQTPEVASVIQEVLSQTPRDISKQKGWCLHALYCALWCLRYFNTLEESFDWVIGTHPGSDTDTNASIAGCLIGAMRGYEALLQEPKTRVNLQTVRTCDSRSGDIHRPVEYSLADFDTLTQSLYDLFGTAVPPRT